MQNTVLQVSYHEVFVKKDFFFVLTEDCFFLVLAYYTQLPSEQPRSTDFFPKTDDTFVNKMLPSLPVEQGNSKPKYSDTS